MIDPANKLESLNRSWKKDSTNIYANPTKINPHAKYWLGVLNNGGTKAIPKIKIAIPMAIRNIPISVLPDRLGSNRSTNDTILFFTFLI